MLPFIYEPNKSIEVNKKTIDFLESNPKTKEKIQLLGLIYHSIEHIIPQTTENFWSGHFFPYQESWDELQVSFNLVCFGFYKQAMSSLRSALELGLLSIYHNINDEGHLSVKEWLNSSDYKEADTPNMINIWKILIRNPNIKEFQSHIDLKERLLSLRYLHNYVHTKGHKFSNELGLITSNFQTFEEKAFRDWLIAFEEIIIIVTTLHLLKYPTALIKFDYTTKFGIDIPMFPHLQENEIERIERLLPDNYMTELNKIASEDPKTKEFLDWIKSFPDMSEEDIEEQIIDMGKRDIERQGLEDYKHQQLILYRSENFDELPDKVKLRIKKLQKWASDNNYVNK